MSVKTAHHHHTGQTNAGGAEDKSAHDPALPRTEAHDRDQFTLTQIQAYLLWEQGGKPNDDGARERFWHEAEKAITAPCSTCG